MTSDEELIQAIDNDPDATPRERDLADRLDDLLMADRYRRVFRERYREWEEEA